MEADVIKVMEEKWDFLIILDACRYDYFSNIYEDYFLGELKKGISTGSGTPDWFKNSFPDFYSDVIYVSGNPYINSKIEISGCCAKNHFFKVIDVWNFGWSDKLNTVPPREINEYTLNFVKKFPRKRFIIHYLQPHESYLSRNFSVEDILKSSNHKHKYKNVFKWVKEIWHPPPQRRISLEKLLNFLFVKTKLTKNTWKIRDLLNLPPIVYMHAVRRTYGIDGLRKAYEMNLKAGLGYVSQLCAKLLHCQLNKNIVVTSDHGELLGEGGDYCHRPGSRDSILREVPFFRVKCVKARELDALREIVAEEEKEAEERFTKEDEERVKARLSALGYIG